MDVRKLDKLSSSKECANEDDFPKRSMSSGRFSNRSKLIKIRDLRILEFSMDEHRRENFSLETKCDASKRLFRYFLRAVKDRVTTFIFAFLFVLPLVIRSSTCLSPLHRNLSLRNRYNLIILLFFAFTVRTSRKCSFNSERD